MGRLRQCQLPMLTQSRSGYSLYNPFVSHDFLSALEDVEIGRRPHRLAAAACAGQERRTATLVAAAPCYLKSHSRGEYVFDRGWAEAYERAGGSYYPKLQVAVPFTPATGPRLLLRRGPRLPTRSAGRWPAA